MLFEDSRKGPAAGASESKVVEIKGPQKKAVFSSDDSRAIQISFSKLPRADNVKEALVSYN